MASCVTDQVELVKKWRPCSLKADRPFVKRKSPINAKMMSAEKLNAVTTVRKMRSDTRCFVVSLRGSGADAVGAEGANVELTRGSSPVSATNKRAIGERKVNEG